MIDLERAARLANIWNYIVNEELSDQYKKY